MDDTINIVESYREFAASDLICLDFVSDFANEPINLWQVFGRRKQDPERGNAMNI